MEVVLTVLLGVLILGVLLSNYFLIKANRGNFRLLERERNVHNQQVSELLDRLAHAHDRPYNLPDRPLKISPPAQEEEAPDLEWRAV